MRYDGVLWLRCVMAAEGFRDERHVVYWRRLSNGDVGIVTILHERMRQIDRFREDFGS